MCIKQSGRRRDRSRDDFAPFATQSRTPHRNMREHMYLYDICDGYNIMIRPRGASNMLYGLRT